MTKFSTWAPDADPHVEGVITSLSNMIPTTRGYKVAPGLGTKIGGDLSGACRGAASLRKLSGSVRVFAGADTAIYEYTAGAWSDVATPTYTGGASNRWRFAQFGDASLATNDADQLQVATTGNFAAVANSPKAKVLFTVPNFVILLNTNDGSGSPAYGDQGDRWWCSGFQDYTVWTPALSTQCNTGRLIGPGGDITAGLSLNDGFVAYKRNAMWFANYVGTPEVFRFDLVSDYVGCVGPEAVVDIGNAHVFVGTDDIWIFDGHRPRSLLEGTLRDWWRNDISRGNEHLSQCVYDFERKIVWIFYPRVGSSSVCNGILCYHVPTGKFGFIASGISEVGVQAVFRYTEPGITWANIASTYSTWEALESSNLTWGSGWWTAGLSSIAFVKAVSGGGAAVYTIDDAANVGTITSHWIGSPTADSMVSRVFPVMYSDSPTQVDLECKMIGGDDWATTNQQQRTAGTGLQFEVRGTARWHRLTFSMSNTAEMIGFETELKPAGLR